MATVHASLHPQDGTPQIANLQTVAQLWNAGRSGVLRTAWGRARLIQGEPRSPEDLTVVVRSIYEGGHLQFNDAESFGSTPPPRLGPVLWECARRGADAGALRPSSRLVPKPGVKRLAALPIGHQASALLLNHQRSDIRLNALVRTPKPERRAAVADLATLVAMGLLAPRTRQAAAPSPPQDLTAPPPQPPVEPQPQPRRRKRRRAHATARPSMKAEHLERAWEAMQDADDWTVLGLPRNADADMVDQAIQRLNARYRAVLHNGTVAMCQRARQLLARVDEAGDRVRGGRATSSGGANALTAFDDGKQALEDGRVAEALKLLAIARQSEPFNPRIKAWLGWAIAHDPNRSPTARRKKGEALLNESAGLGCADADYLLARLDIADGDLVRAWTRLDNASRRDPEHAEVRGLLVQVQKDVKKI